MLLAKTENDIDASMRQGAAWKCNYINRNNACVKFAAFCQFVKIPLGGEFLN